MAGRLLHTGQVILDLVMRVPALPERGGDVLAAITDLLPGGGFNVMSAAARSGAQVCYAGAHGAGRFGDQVRSALRAEGIAVAQPPADEGDTGICVALVDEDGERTFVTGTGAEGRLTVERLGAVEVRAEDLVYVSGYSLLHDANRAALLDWLPRAGAARVLFDPGPLVAAIDSAALAAVLAVADLVSCNAAEASRLTGAGEPAAAAGVLSERVASVVVRTGAAGCVVAADGGTQQVPGFPVRAVDTNGAGDTHCGVLAAQLLHGAALVPAALRANAAAALSVERHGPATAPSAAEIDEFVARHG